MGGEAVPLPLKTGKSSPVRGEVAALCADGGVDFAAVYCGAKKGCAALSCCNSPYKLFCACVFLFKAAALCIAEKLRDLALFAEKNAAAARAFFVYRLEP